MVLPTLAILSLLSTLGSTLPGSTGPLRYPPTSLSANFRLIANVTSGDLNPSINSCAIASYHISAGIDYAILVPSTLKVSRIFYVNGTAEEVYYRTSNVLSDEGTPLFPAGIVVNDPDSTGRRSVTINAGIGEEHIGLTRFPDPAPELQGWQGDGFYACKNEKLFETPVQLFYKGKGDTTPEFCADVSLLPECSEGGALEHPYGNTVNCYPDVAAIDWNVYSAY